jgi:hypothetical protein
MCAVCCRLAQKVPLLVLRLLAAPAAAQLTLTALSCSETNVAAVPRLLLDLGTGLQLLPSILSRLGSGISLWVTLVYCLPCLLVLAACHRLFTSSCIQSCHLPRLRACVCSWLVCWPCKAFVVGPGRLRAVLAVLSLEVVLPVSVLRCWQRALHACLAAWSCRCPCWLWVQRRPALATGCAVSR